MNGKTKRNTVAAVSCLAALALTLAAVVAFPRAATASVENASGGFMYRTPLVQEVESTDAPDEKATNLIIRLDRNLNVLGGDGSVLMPLGDLDIGDRIPIYYAGSVTAAEAIADMLVKSATADAIAASHDPALVARMRAKAVNVRGLLDCRDRSLETREDLVAVRDDANTNMANIVLLPGSCSADSVRYLRRLSMAVWVASGDDAELVRAASGGANAIVTANPSHAVEFFASLGDGLLTPPMIIAHRGLSGIKRSNGGDYHENTVEAAWAAYKEGGADIIEIDIYLSADGELIVMHDGRLDRTTTGKGNIESMTYEQIKQYKVTGANQTVIGNVLDDIPRLDDYFRKFKGEDCNIFIEIKGTKPEIIGALKNKIDEFDFGSQCSIILFDDATHSTKGFMPLVREQMPNISVGLLADNGGEAMTNVIRRINPLNATFNPGYGTLTRERIDAYNRLGVTVWPWTFGGEDNTAQKSDFEEMYINAAGGLTMNTCYWAGEWAKRLVPEERETKCAPNEKFAVWASLVTFSGSMDAEYSFVKISGDLKLSLDSNGYFTAENEGQAYITLTKQSDGLGYTVISEPVIVVCEKKKAEMPPASDDGNGDSAGNTAQGEAPESGCNGCASSFDSVSTTVVAAALLGCAALMLRRKKKKS